MYRRSCSKISIYKKSIDQKIYFNCSEHGKVKFRSFAAVTIQKSVLQVLSTVREQRRRILFLIRRSTAQVIRTMKAKKFAGCWIRLLF